MKHQKYPAYGKILADRLRWQNPPRLVFIEVGSDAAWRRAKKWNTYPDFAALVLTPEAEPKRLIWPVSGCLCLMEWEQAAPEALIIDLVQCLKMAGALKVAVQPMFVDHDSPAYCYDPTTQSFVQIRECLKIYMPRKEKKNAA
jgi:hypothetical protein